MAKKTMKARIYETDAAYTGGSVHGVQVDIFDYEYNEWEMNTFYPDEGCSPSQLLRKLQELKNLEYTVKLHK